MIDKRHTILLMALSITLACTGEVCGQSANSAKKASSQISNDISLNRNVLQFAMDRMGQQVGDGECWTLAAEALRASGAERPVDYTFGTEVPNNPDKWLPGDIIQFTSCLFRQTTPGGGYHEWKVGLPQHTAIIVATANDGQFTVIHQNSGNVKKVQLGNYDLHNLVSGKFKVFRPVPKSAEEADSESDDDVEIVTSRASSTAAARVKMVNESARLITAHNFKEAVDVLDECLKQFPDNNRVAEDNLVVAYRNWAYELYNKRDYEACVVPFAKYMSLWKAGKCARDQDALDCYVFVLEKLGRADEAHQFLQTK